VRIDVFTIFPDVVDTFCSASLLGKARRAGLLDVRTHDPRDQATDVHRTVDDSPFGGGAGMLMRPEPIFAAVEAADPPRPLFLLGPGGRRFDQSLAAQLAAGDGFSLLCGRYEGVDHRIREHLVDDELSVGDVVLAGGEVAACLVIEAVVRLLPGVEESPQWLLDPTLAMLVVIAATVWKGFPFYSLVLLSALQGVPDELYEAATMDGAGRVGQFRYITLPGIRGSLALLAVLGFIYSTQQFTLIWLITGGGPVDATTTLAPAIYMQAFRFYDFGYAGGVLAGGVILFRNDRDLRHG